MKPGFRDRLHSMLVLVPPLAPALVPPGVNYEEEENKETQHQQPSRSWPILAEQPEVSEELVEIHAAPIYTRTAKSQKPKPEWRSSFEFLGSAARGLVTARCGRGNSAEYRW